MKKLNLILFITYIVMINQLQYNFVQSLSVNLNEQQQQPQQHHPKRHHRRHSPNMWTILGQTVVKSENSEPIINDSSSSSQIVDADFSDSILMDKINAHNHHTTHMRKNELSPCPKCQNRPEIRMTEEQLTELRIKYVKNQILKKLKLSEKPQVSISSLPKPVAEGATIRLDSEENELSGIQDDFYAKTTQKIIFPEIGEFFFCGFYFSFHTLFLELF